MFLCAELEDQSSTIVHYEDSSIKHNLYTVYLSFPDLPHALELTDLLEMINM